MTEQPTPAPVPAPQQAPAPPQQGGTTRVMVVSPEAAYAQEHHPFGRESRQASKAALGLPDDHPGFVPLSAEPWKPYEICKGVCGRPVSDHAPSFDERLWSVHERIPGALQTMQGAGWQTGDVAGAFPGVEHYAVVPGTRFNGVDGLVCSAGCLYLQEPQHEVFEVDRAAGVDVEKALAPEIRRIRRLLALQTVSEHHEGPVS